MIGVIDLEISNISSVSRALHYLKIDHQICGLQDLEKIRQADSLILPGVGSFFEGARRLNENGIADIIRARVLQDRVPILGICLGMQLFASFGEEGGGAEGLGLVKGKVLQHRAAAKGCLIPHIGWNDVRGGTMSVFSDIAESTCFYFVHSYELILEEDINVAVCDYGEEFVAGFEKDNIVGVQFHPEKSQKCGLKLLENFCQGRVLC